MSIQRNIASCIFHFLALMHRRSVRGGRGGEENVIDFEIQTFLSEE
jgi:hypothetical protein